VKEQQARLLAAEDMEQAAASARALGDGANDVHLTRALETALAVSYARAFTQGSLLRLDRADYRPCDPTLADLHDELIRLRDKVYAHTDKASGRSTTVTTTTSIGRRAEGDTEITIEMEYREEWPPFRREAISDAPRLFEGQRDRLLSEAADRQVRLEWPL
jgi:hypothetical protein